MYVLLSRTSRSASGLALGRTAVPPEGLGLLRYCGLLLIGDPPIALSPALGLETGFICRTRVRAQAEGALAVTKFLKEQKGVFNVRYPFDDGHPQSALARRQMSGGRTIVTFELEGGREEAFRFANALKLIDISNNLGDAKSLLTHPDTTTHARLPEAERRMVGITPGMFRLSIGLEDPLDLMDDISVGLQASR